MPQRTSETDLLALHVEAMAFQLAERWHQRTWPRASAATAERWAARHWPRFRERAIDVLAVLSVVREKDGQDALPGIPSLD